MAALHLFSGQTAFATAAPIVSSAKQMHHKSVKNPNPSIKTHLSSLLKSPFYSNLLLFIAPFIKCHLRSTTTESAHIAQHLLNNIREKNRFFYHTTISKKQL
jgi:hypothetical protein